MTKLEDIGFYTLCDQRARTTSATSPLQRGELILTYKCNFKCGYCRGPRPGFGQDTTYAEAARALQLWCEDGLQHVRFSGGDPLTYPHLEALVVHARLNGVKRIAVSTNGSFPLDRYKKLIACGVNDFSISLDACCAADGDRIAGNEGSWTRVVHNIRTLSALTYVSTGVVLTPENAFRATDIISKAHHLGVADIRVITAAQEDKLRLESLGTLDDDLLARHPILKYRALRLRDGLPMRGLSATDHHRCPLIYDDSVIHGDLHYPCVIYLREHGEPIGQVRAQMRRERVRWAQQHDTYTDPICRKNCLDVCVAYNNRVRELRPLSAEV